MKSMQTRLLGEQGLAVSGVGLGCMGMSDFYGSYDQGNSFATLEQAISCGVTFWDTSDISVSYTHLTLPTTPYV